MAHDVFVDYLDEDFPVGNAIVTGLENKGIRCWTETRDLTPGPPYSVAINTAIKASRIMVVVISGNSNQSRGFVEEVGIALASDLIIIPFRIENINPTGKMAFYLSAARWLDAFTPPLEEHVDKLVDTIMELLGIEAPAVPDPVEKDLDVENRIRRENNGGGFRNSLNNSSGTHQRANPPEEQAIHQNESYDQESQLRVVDSLEVHGPSSQGLIQFCVGDLTKLGPRDCVDVLVVSAFRDIYYPRPGSLIGALHQKGVSVRALSENKEVDLRQAFSCWVSREISNPPQGIRFKRILCFEPAETAQAAELVGDIFRSLAPFLGGHFPVRTVATPLVASGFQRISSEIIFQQLVETAVHWISSGLPLSCLKIVCLPDKNITELTRLFSELKLRHSKIAPQRRGKFSYDFFISYSHNDTGEVKFFEQTLLHLQQDLRIFVDRKNLKTGAAWQREIFESIDDCQKVVVFYSPAYLDSKVCIEEFNIALCRHRESDEPVLMPIYLYSAKLPTYMRLVQFLDCREADQKKLNQAADELIRNARE